MSLKTNSVVSTAWLAEHLADADLRLLDCTFLLPAAAGVAQAASIAAHIPGALYFDIEAVSDRHNDLPHMLPPAERFAEVVGALGIGNAQQVVLYDNGAVPNAVAMAGAARAWWMFRVFGHERVSVLDGGLPKWRLEGRPVTAIRSPVAAQPFVVRQEAAGQGQRLLRSKAQVRENAHSQRERVVDARSAGRFNGNDPEPRPGLRRGSSPNSVNVPFMALLDPVSKTLLPAAALRAVFAQAGVAETERVVASCGSGVTACVVALALHSLGRTDVAVYDGSWAEWGREG